MSINAIRPWHRANKACFKESCPFINKASVSTKVILIEEIFCISFWKYPCFKSQLNIWGGGLMSKNLLKYHIINCFMHGKDTCFINT